MTLIPFGRPQVVKLDSARPHVTAPCRCAACEHEWVAVVPAPAPDTLECPKCAVHTMAARHARVHTALGVLDNLREAVFSGKIVGFAAVGIEDDDSIMMWCSSTGNVSRLRMMGAISNLQHHYSHGTEGLDQ